MSLHSETAINLRYEYGGEYFTCSLYRDDRGWVLHPFDGILMTMCTLVAQELFKHKPLQVMLAKEGILFTDIRPTVNLTDHLDLRYAYNLMTGVGFTGGLGLTLTYSLLLPCEH